MPRQLSTSSGGIGICGSGSSSRRKVVAQTGGRSGIGIGIGGREQGAGVGRQEAGGDAPSIRI